MGKGMSEESISFPDHPEWGLRLFSRPVRSLKHWLEHYLMIEPTKIGMFKKDGVLHIGFQCKVCGKITSASPWGAGRNG